MQRSKSHETLAPKIKTIETADKNKQSKARKKNNPSDKNL